MTPKESVLGQDKNTEARNMSPMFQAHAPGDTQGEHLKVELPKGGEWGGVKRQTVESWRCWTKCP